MSRSGAVALVGRPNAGKSTLMNQLLREKVAIVSDKPQTTRQRLVGILSEERGQMVFHDTPGIHRPLYRLNRQMVRHALDALGDADVVCMLVDATQPFGSGDAYMLDLVAKARGPRFLALNKIDVMRKSDLLPEIARYAASGAFAEIVPISAATGDGCDRLLDLLWTALPEGPPRYDPELLTTHPERFLVAERIREKVLEQTREELPFATAVVIDRWEEDPDEPAQPPAGAPAHPPAAGAARKSHSPTGAPMHPASAAAAPPPSPTAATVARKPPLVRIFASILVEKPSQKKILVGHRGQKIRDIGIAARLDLESFLERRLYLELHVRVEPNWRENHVILAQLDRDVDLDLG